MLEMNDFNAFNVINVVRQERLLKSLRALPDRETDCEDSDWSNHSKSGINRQDQNSASIKHFAQCRRV